FFRITLPLGISFDTFQSMSYAIDVYRGDARAFRNFTNFACCVALFPQLVLALYLMPVSAIAANWPHWRGPNRNDQSAEDSGWDSHAWPVDKALWSTNVG